MIVIFLKNDDSPTDLLKNLQLYYTYKILRFRRLINQFCTEPFFGLLKAKLHEKIILIYPSGAIVYFLFLS